MEHRWGKRFAVNATVRLHIQTKTVLSAQLDNASLSGGFIRTDAPVQAYSHVVVELPGAQIGRKRAQRIAAYTVRATALGIGLEWCEFAPAPIIALLAQQHGASASAAPGANRDGRQDAGQDPHTLAPKEDSETARLSSRAS